MLSSGKVFRAVMRGKLRLLNEKVLAGDIVDIRPEPDGKTCRIEKILPRKNELLRPPLANVDQVIVVTAISKPPCDLLYIDRVLVQIESLGIEGVVCINKEDLENPLEIQKVKEIYQKAGYRCLVTSAALGTGLSEFVSILRGKVTVLAGQSGVGKSRLLSSLLGEGLLTNELSRFGRGRHTTKWVSLFRGPGDGFIADTPGFSRLDLVPCEPEELGSYFKEFRQYLGSCYFPRCLHKTENPCGIKEAVERGDIARERYENYLSLLDEAIEMDKLKYKK